MELAVKTEHQKKQKKISIFLYLPLYVGQKFNATYKKQPWFYLKRNSVQGLRKSHYKAISFDKSKTCPKTANRTFIRCFPFVTRHSRSYKWTDFLFYIMFKFSLHNQRRCGLNYTTTGNI